jgi:hypothetical protein
LRPKSRTDDQDACSWRSSAPIVHHHDS